MATRVFLGVFEGGLFPGVNYYISQWYVRNECGYRMALFFSAATLAGAFGGILARGIAEMVRYPTSTRSSLTLRTRAA
jgi:MFS family permease